MVSSHASRQRPPWDASTSTSVPEAERPVASRIVKNPRRLPSGDRVQGVVESTSSSPKSSRIKIAWPLHEQAQAPPPPIDPVRRFFRPEWDSSGPDPLNKFAVGMSSGMATSPERCTQPIVQHLLRQISQRLPTAKGRLRKALDVVTRATLFAMEARSQARRAGEIIGEAMVKADGYVPSAKETSFFDSMDRLATSALDALDELYEHGVWLQSQMDHVVDCERAILAYKDALNARSSLRTPRDASRRLHVAASSDAELFHMHSDAQTASVVAAQSIKGAKAALTVAAKHSSSVSRAGHACKSALQRVLQQPGQVAIWEANGMGRLVEAVLHGDVVLDSGLPQTTLGFSDGLRGQYVVRPYSCKGVYLTDDADDSVRLDWRGNKQSIAAAQRRAERAIEDAERRAASAARVQAVVRGRLARRKSRKRPPAAIVL